MNNEKSDEMSIISDNASTSYIANWTEEEQTLLEDKIATLEINEENLKSIIQISFLFPSKTIQQITLRIHWTRLKHMYSWEEYCHQFQKKDTPIQSPKTPSSNHSSNHGSNHSSNHNSPRFKMDKQTNRRSVNICTKSRQEYKMNKKRRSVPNGSEELKMSLESKNDINISPSSSSIGNYQSHQNQSQPKTIRKGSNRLQTKLYQKSGSSSLESIEMNNQNNSLSNSSSSRLNVPTLNIQNLPTMNPNENNVNQNNQRKTIVRMKSMDQIHQPIQMQSPKSLNEINQSNVISVNNINNINNVNNQMVLETSTKRPSGLRNVYIDNPEMTNQMNQFNSIENLNTTNTVNQLNIQNQPFTQQQYQINTINPVNQMNNTINNNLINQQNTNQFNQQPRASHNSHRHQSLPIHLQNTLQTFNQTISHFGMIDQFDNTMQQINFYIQENDYWLSMIENSIMVNNYIYPEHVSSFANNLNTLMMLSDEIAQPRSLPYLQIMLQIPPHISQQISLMNNQQIPQQINQNINQNGNQINPMNQNIQISQQHIQQPQNK